MLFGRIYFQFLKKYPQCSTVVLKPLTEAAVLLQKTNKRLTATTFLTEAFLVMDYMWMHWVSLNNQCFILFTNHLLWLVSYTCPSLSMWKLSHKSFFIHETILGASVSHKLGLPQNPKCLFLMSYDFSVNENNFNSLITKHYHGQTHSESKVKRVVIQGHGSSKTASTSSL